jgi:membrane-bound lytic murein transglycosylase D
VAVHPRDAKIFGLTVNSWVDERKDPEASTVAAARYLKHLYGLFNSWPLALASYNAGEGVVIDAVKRQGTKDFWSLRLPQQTKDYVPKFMAVLAISRDPARYGFDSVELEDPLAFDEVTIPGPVDLRALASACGTTTEEVKRLNPMFLRNAAPPKGDMVTLRVPDGSGERLMSSLEDGKLSLAQGRDARRSRRPAPQDPPRRVAQVPRPTVRRAAADDCALQPPRQEEPPAGRPHGLIPMDGRGASSSSASKVASAHGASKTIKVRSGDTLSAIADRHGCSVATLRAMNGLSKKSVVKAGQRLKVPAQS